MFEYAKGIGCISGCTRGEEGPAKGTFEYAEGIGCISGYTQDKEGPGKGTFEDVEGVGGGWCRCVSALGACALALLLDCCVSALSAFALALLLDLG